MPDSIPTRTLSSFAAGVVAALVVTLVVTSAWRVDAAPGDDDATFVPITNCRLFDIRPAPNTVGARTSPLGPGESYPVQVTGDNGECTGIPADAVAVALNVTVVGATANTHLAVVPSEVTGDPGVSNLNVSAGQPAFPNKVDVKLGADGKVRFFNFAGSVYVLADIVGYYTPSSLQELVDTRPFARHISGQQASQSVGATAEVIQSVQITPPVDGTVIAQSTAPFDMNAATTVICTLSDSNAQDTGYNQYLSGADTYGTLAGQRAFDVTAGATLTVNLVCRATGGTATYFDTTLTATFYAGEGTATLTERFVEGTGTATDPAPAGSGDS